MRDFFTNSRYRQGPPNFKLMDYITPHQFLLELKKLLEIEKAKLNEQKNIAAKYQEFETATLYREIEKKLISFLIELEFKTTNNIGPVTTISPAETNLNNEYKAISEEVKDFVTTHNGILTSFPNYKGVQILYSELKHKPKFMFIGINPGAGYYKKYGQNVEKYDAAEGLEYIEETYTLGEETKHLFDLAGCFNDLFGAVKTNWTFLATPNSGNLDHLLTSLLNEHKINLYTTSDSWVKRLIEIVQPEIILCEGKKAFDRITWNVLGSRETNPFNEVGYRQTELCKHVIGYKRNPFGRIENKEAVAQKIREVAYGQN